jgi:hypothetical protein
MRCTLLSWRLPWTAMLMWPGSFSTMELRYARNEFYFTIVLQKGQLCNAKLCVGGGGGFEVRNFGVECLLNESNCIHCLGLFFCSGEHAC